MKKLLILLTVAFTACTSQVKTEKKGNENPNEQENTITVIPLNNGNKWKADQATKKNVAAMVQVVNDGNYADTGKRRQLYANVQTKIDTLVIQCSMQGAEHEALHLWLEKVLKDMKKLKEESTEYREVHATLKKDIANFYAFFE